MFQRVRGTLGRVHEVQAFFGFFFVINSDHQSLARITHMRMQLGPIFLLNFTQALTVIPSWKRLQFTCDLSVCAWLIVVDRGTRQGKILLRCSPCLYFFD